MTQENHIASILSDSLLELSCQLSPQEVLNLLETPKDDNMGDLAFPCFTLAKGLKLAPNKISQNLMGSLKSKIDPQIVKELTTAGPYINFKYQTKSLAESIIPKALNGQWTQNATKTNEQVMVEYSQPNTHKAFHVGHTRNVALGDALVRLYKWAGYEVTAVNYIGDIGAHIARCLWYFKKYYKGDEPKTNRGEFLGDMYVKSTSMLDFKTLTQAPHLGVITAKVLSIEPHPKNEDWSVIKIHTGTSEHHVVCGGNGFELNDIVPYAPVGVKISGREVKKIDKLGVTSDGVICSEKELSLSKDKNKIFVFSPKTTLGDEVANVLALKNATLSQKTVVEEIQTRTQEVSSILKALEAKEDSLTQLWEKTKKWSMDDLYEIYDWLGAQFDHYFFESEIGDRGKEIVKDFYKKGVLVKSEGALGADLSSYNLPFLLLLKSDGTGLYSTKDLALAETKFKKYNIDRNIYVVDDGQSLHFQQIFATLKLLGFENADKCHHLAYGKVERPDGKMSSRKGNVILFSELKTQLVHKIKSEYLSKYEGQWTPENIEDTAHKIALATIRYGMLNQDSAKNIVFDLDEWTARSGNTGPYMMYAYARINSMLVDSGLEDSLQGADLSIFTQDAEHRLLMQISRFRKLALKAALKYEPHIICTYMYDLAKAFSSFYSQCPVLNSKQEDLKLARLALCKATSVTLKKSMELIGIQTVNKM